MSPSSVDENGKIVASAGRGGLALTVGKLFFLAAGLVQQIVLKAILGLSGYGALSTTLSIASIAYNPMVQAGIQGVSRATANLDNQVRPSVVRQLLKFHLFLALALSALFFLLAPILANALGAPHIVAGVRVLSLVLFLYGLYAPLVGVLNGERRFVAQASLDAIAAALRTLGLLGGAYVGTQLLVAASHNSTSSIAPASQATIPILWTCLGFAAAASIVLLIAAKQAGLGQSGPTQLTLLKGYGRALRHIWAGQILLNVLFQADALLLRRFAASAAMLAQLPDTAADRYVGAYRAAQLFCFLPFQLLTSVTFVLFPLLAQAHAQGHRQEVATLFSRGVRLSLLLTGALVSVLLARPEGLLVLVFGGETAELAAPAMRILAVGMGAFSLLGVMTTALNSLGQERLSLALIFLATLLVGALCVSIVHDQSLNQQLLERTAAATSLAMIVTTMVAARLLQTRVGASLHFISCARTIIAMIGAALTTEKLLPSGTLWTLFAAPTCIAVYVLLQVLTREITAEDWTRLKALIHH